MNLELAYGVLDILQTMQDAVKKMRDAYSLGNIEEFDMLSMDLRDGLAVVREITMSEKSNGENNRLRDACISALESLKDIKKLVYCESKEVVWKLECELLMIIENAYLEFFCWEIGRKEPEKMKELHGRIKSTGAFYRLEQPPEKRVYSSDLSIFMPAYNHIDYTKLCVDSILTNLPQNIKCEIILYNHGCNDGTKEFFESIPGIHVLNVAVNRSVNTVGIRATGGKYSLYVSNDIVIGKNAIENLYRAISEHDDYGWVVPSTSAVSNLQSIPAIYNSMKEFEIFTAKNNIYDEKRHEARVRLCNPVTMIRTDDYHQLQLDLYEQMYCISNVSSFPDDKVSLWMRRHGYKSILAKDAYCHHAGSITHKSDFKTQQDQQKFYTQGREVFYENFGIDPWGTGFCYDYELFEKWNLCAADDLVVLGINCGLGSNSLKIKEALKEMGAQRTTLYNAIQKENYLYDLQGISDVAFLFKDIKDIVQKTGKSKFNYIVIEETIYGYKSDSYLQLLEDVGISFDEMAYKDEAGDWHIVR